MALYGDKDKQAVAAEATENTQVAEQATPADNLAHLGGVEAQPMTEPQGGSFTNQFAQAGNGSQAQAQPQGGFASGNVLGLLRETLFKPITAGAISERISKVRDTFVEIYEAAKKTNPQVLDVDFIVAPGNKIANFYGGIILALPMRIRNEAKIVTHLIIVENSVPLQHQIENINGQQLKIINTATNTVNADTFKGVQSLVSHHYGNTGVQVIDTGFTLIPTELNLDDAAALRHVLDQAAGSLFSYGEVVDGKLDADVTITLANAMRSRELRAFANIEEHPAGVVTTTGLPVRSDFTIKSVAVLNQTQNTQQYQTEALELGQANVYCTPVFAQPAQAFGNNPYQAPVTQHYFNQIVIKDVKAGPEIRLTPAAALMMIGTTGVLTINDLWKRAYIPNMHISPNDVDIKDIGAFGFELPQINQSGKAEMFPTKTNEFGPEQFNRYMAMLFHSDSIYQIDIEDGNALLSIFAQEAAGDTGARARIFDIVNNLTGGKFSEYFSPNTQMFINTNNRVMVGYYKDKHGQMKSLDTVDHLAMLNLTKGDARTMMDFSISDNDAAPSTLRLGMRTQILEALTGDSVVVKSYANRLTINPAFMTAMIRALKDSGVFPEINNQFAKQTDYNRYAADHFSRWTVSQSQMPTNLFGGYGYNGNPNVGAVTQPYIPSYWR